MWWHSSIQPLLTPWITHNHVSYLPTLFVQTHMISIKFWQLWIQHVSHQINRCQMCITQVAQCNCDFLLMDKWLATNGLEVLGSSSETVGYSWNEWRWLISDWTSKLFALSLVNMVGWTDLLFISDIFDWNSAVCTSSMCSRVYASKLGLNYIAAAGVEWTWAWTIGQCEDIGTFLAVASI